MKINKNLIDIEEQDSLVDLKFDKLKDDEGKFKSVVMSVFYDKTDKLYYAKLDAGFTTRVVLCFDELDFKGDRL
jgi:hypothetical protein|tara:strand:+ start:2060 stop:2281 length:222 start_codon:yes stop_codon:yes gene_type:complete